MSNRGLIIVVIVLLLGILGFMVMNIDRRTPTEKVGDSVSEVVEEIGDEIDDNTTAR